jgi:pimeloyl-ACP methyl ester carboxylesterase
MREVLQLELGEEVLTGTRHVPQGRPARTGVLFINFGYVPRDGHGGVAAHACDALAASGIPAYRFDLPRLGDSPGPLPRETLEFFDLVTGGGFVTVTRALVRSLCEREGLEGVVLGGLCGGAVTAVFVGDLEPERVRGLVLLEPELYLNEPPRGDAQEARISRRAWLKQRLPSGPRYAPLHGLLALRAPFEPALKRGARAVLASPRLDRLRGSLFNYWGWMRLLTLEGKRGHWIPLPRKAILDFVLSQTELPAVTNLRLVSAWEHLVRARRPMLVVTAEGKLREVFFDRINRVVLKGLATPAVQHVRLARTNHLFTTGGAIDAVIATVLPWVTALAVRPPSERAG